MVCHYRQASWCSGRFGARDGKKRACHSIADVALITCFHLHQGGPLLDIATPKSIPSDHMTICELWEHAQSGDPSSEAERRTTSSAHAVVVGKNAVLFLTFAPIAEEERNAMSAQADGVPPGLDVWIVDGKLKEGYHPQVRPYIAAALTRSCWCISLHEAETQTYFSAACLKHGQVVVGCQDGSIHVYQGMQPYAVVCPVPHLVTTTPEIRFQHGSGSSWPHSTRVWDVHLAHGSNHRREGWQSKLFCAVLLFSHLLNRVCTSIASPLV